MVEQYLTKEITAGRIIGPFSPIDIPGVQVSRMGVVPKHHQPNKRWLITDLSFPPHTSVNDGIDSSLCSMQYTSVSKVARAAQSMGRCALMAKLNIEAAHCLVSVHPQDRPLLGVPPCFSVPSRQPIARCSALFQCTLRTAHCWVFRLVSVYPHDSPLLGVPPCFSVPSRQPIARCSVA